MLSCCCLVSKSYLILLQPHGLEPARLIYPWDFSGKNTGVGCHFLPQGNFPTQGSNPGLLHSREPPGNPKEKGKKEARQTEEILDWSLHMIPISLGIQHKYERFSSA